MIPETINSILETNTTGKSFKFRFEANRHLFEAFSKNLYSNPHESVVREIISNAIDSQVRANTQDKPLTIILNNEFIVQDNGTGISPDKMENCVGVYGVSDKRETNDEIGMYGFGFKSPFAISDQFVVETVPGDGYKYIWVIYKDLTGSGEINLTNQIESSEPTGTKVRVPIKASDCQIIQRCILKYINFLKPWPITHFPHNYMADQPSVLIETDDYIEVNKSYNDNILYDGWMPYYISNTRIPPQLFIKIKKGDLRLSASRENVTVTNNLHDIINNKVEKYFTDIIEKSKENVLKSEDVMHIIDICNRVIEKYEIYLNKNLIIYIKNHPKYGDFTWPDSFNYYTTYKKNMYNKIYKSSNMNVNKDMKLVYISEDNLEKLDTPYYKMKIKHLMKQGFKEIVVLRDNNLQQKTSPIFKHLFDNVLDIVKYKVPRPTSYNSGEKRKYEKNTISASVFNDNKYIDTRVKFKEGNYVYSVKKYEIDMLPKNNKQVQFCIVSRRVLKKLNELTNWTTVKDYIIEQSAKFTENDIRIFQTKSRIDHTYTFIKDLFNKNLISINDMSCNNIQQLDPEDAKMIDLAINYGSIEIKNNIKDIDILDNVKKEYPLLGYINEYKISNDKKALQYIEEYIKMIKEKNKCQSA